MNQIYLYHTQKFPSLLSLSKFLSCFLSYFFNLETKTAKESSHWAMERVVSVALIPALSVGIYSPNTVCNGVLALALPIHCHWGVQQVITDYLPARRAGAIHYAALGSLYVATGLSILGLAIYNANDIGIGEGINLLWKGPSSSGNESAETK